MESFIFAIFFCTIMLIVWATKNSNKKDIYASSGLKIDYFYKGGWGGLAISVDARKILCFAVGVKQFITIDFDNVESISSEHKDYYGCCLHFTVRNMDNAVYTVPILTQEYKECFGRLQILLNLKHYK